MRRGGAEIIRRLPDGGTVEAFYGNMVDEDCWFVIRFDENHFQLDKEGETFYKKEEAAKAVSNRVRGIKNGEEFSAEELRTGHANFDRRD